MLKLKVAILFCFCVFILLKALWPDGRFYILYTVKGQIVLKTATFYTL